MAYQCDGCSESFNTQAELDAHRSLYSFTHGNRQASPRPASKGQRKRKFSDVSKDGRCPKCGGTEFKAKRPIGRTVTAGVLTGIGALAVRRSQVRCVTCGTIYRRQ